MRKTLRSLKTLAAGAIVVAATVALATVWPRFDAAGSFEREDLVESAGEEPMAAASLELPIGGNSQDSPGQAAELDDQHGASEERLSLLPGSGPSGLPGDAASEQVPESNQESPCDRPQAPLPAPGVAGATGFWQAFREPLPPAAVWNPPGPKRVGLQAGHWRVEEVPPELGRLGPGTSGGGRAEWQVNLDLAQRAAGLLREAGVEVEVLPATVPPGYRAHAFLSIHADGDEAGVLRGYKLARAGFSATPEADDHLLATLYAAYGQATGLPRDDLHVSRRMTAYYAFNSRRYCHAVAPGVPAAILEAGFLTNAIDRQVLLGRPDAAAQGIAEGLLRYLGGQVAISQ